MKKAVIIVVMFVVMLGRIGIAYGEYNPPAIYSGTGVVMDSSTGEILYQKTKMNKRILPA